jgi:predicted AlkP superfamily phosphohydrolase/phosphomutase
MKILVLGLDGAAPELLLGDERLGNIRCLMEAGCYGRLEGVTPPAAVPSWMCLSTSQDPGSLGVYGPRDRADRSYDGPSPVRSRSIDAVAIWDQVARQGGKSILIGVPPNDPPREVDGISVGDFLAPGAAEGAFARPASLADEIRRVVGEDTFDIRGTRDGDKARLLDQIVARSRKQFEVARHFLREAEWGYFQFVEDGLDRVHRSFWSDHDPLHVRHNPGSPFKDAIRDYYLHLDEEIGRVLELLTDDTVVLVVSGQGARRLDGGFCVNEWLVREGYLVLNHDPDRVTPFSELEVNWDETRAWCEGGDYARVYLNVAGREPRGSVSSGDYDRFRDELKARLEATTDAEGRTLGTRVFNPEEIYREVRGVAPDLIAYLGGLAWRSIDSVGHSALHVRQGAAGVDDCNPDPHGAFVLASANGPISGEVVGAHLLDMAPTLLELAGYDVPASMQGRSLVAGLTPGRGSDGSVDDEAMVRDRLRGLGYLG